jgi:2-desacetyl-2-hydroxyethyl bacteriochlorophyllide A dehydrogenase
MKAIVNTAPNQLALLEYPLPEPGLGQVRIRSGVCGICATDLELIAGWERTSPPTVPGHEWAGRVDAVGAQVDPTLVGKRCVAENVLSDGGEVGFEHPGAYGEYFLTEARNLHLLPDDFPMTTAALIEPLAVVTHALKRLRLANYRKALISGDGPIGLLTVMGMRRAGVEEIIVVGGRAGRLALARTLGAAATFNFIQLGDDLIATIQRQFGGAFSCIVEASGSASGLENALQIINREGQILLVGDYRAARANFRWNVLLHREIELIGSNASAGGWNEAVRLAVEERLPLDRLISHTFPAAGFEEAFALVRSQGDDVVKVILEW